MNKNKPIVVYRGIVVPIGIKLVRTESLKHYAIKTTERYLRVFRPNCDHPRR